MIELKRMNIARNDISHLNIELLNNLENIDLNNNKISNLNALINIFALPKLKHIAIKDNPISSIFEYFLYHIKVDNKGMGDKSRNYLLEPLNEEKYSSNSVFNIKQLTENASSNQEEMENTKDEVQLDNIQYNKLIEDKYQTLKYEANELTCDILYNLRYTSTVNDTKENIKRDEGVQAELNSKEQILQDKSEYNKQSMSCIKEVNIIEVIEEKLLNMLNYIEGTVHEDIIDDMEEIKELITNYINGEEYLRREYKQSLLSLNILRRERNTLNKKISEQENEINQYKQALFIQDEYINGFKEKIKELTIDNYKYSTHIKEMKLELDQLRINRRKRRTLSFNMQAESFNTCPECIFEIKNLKSQLQEQNKSYNKLFETYTNLSNKILKANKYLESKLHNKGSCVSNNTEVESVDCLIENTKYYVKKVKKYKKQLKELKNERDGCIRSMKEELNNNWILIQQLQEDNKYHKDLLGQREVELNRMQYNKMYKQELDWSVEELSQRRNVMITEIQNIQREHELLKTNKEELENVIQRNKKVVKKIMEEIEIKKKECNELQLTLRSEKMKLEKIRLKVEESKDSLRKLENKKGVKAISLAKLEAGELKLRKKLQIIDHLVSNTGNQEPTKKKEEQDKKLLNSLNKMILEKEAMLTKTSHELIEREEKLKRCKKELKHQKEFLLESSGNSITI